MKDMWFWILKSDQNSFKAKYVLILLVNYDILFYLLSVLLL